jgi:hypothetical protein
VALQNARKYIEENKIPKVWGNDLIIPIYKEGFPCRTHKAYFQNA